MFSNVQLVEIFKSAWHRSDQNQNQINCKFKVSPCVTNGWEDLHLQVTMMIHELFTSLLDAELFWQLIACFDGDSDIQCRLETHRKYMHWKYSSPTAGHILRFYFPIYSALIVYWQKYVLFFQADNMLISPFSGMV